MTQAPKHGPRVPTEPFDAESLIADALEVLERHRRRRRAAAIFGVSTLAFALVLGAVYGDRLAAMARGERDVFGDPIYRSPHPVDAEALGSIDMALVHSELLPAWMIARARRGQGSSARRAERAHEAFVSLRYSVARDSNMVELIDELEVLLDDDPVRHANRIDYVLWAYNDYLDRNAIPWRVEANLVVNRRSRRRRTIFSTRSYQVLADLETERGERLRLLSRGDVTNTRESWLGHTTHPKDGALVQLDRVQELTVQHVWPSLHPGLTTRLPLTERRFASHVRQEAFAQVAPELLALLHEAAVDQQALIEVADSVHARGTCGSSFRIWGLPWNGLNGPDRQALLDALHRSEGRSCPEVTIEEAARMLGASERLGTTDGMAVAVEALATWVARAVSVHELRHVRDEARAPTCEGCPPGTGAGTRAELSAYLAAFGTEGVGYLSLMQACGLDPEGVGPHERALAIATAHLLPNGCLGDPPADLYEQARALEARFFGERDGIMLPADFPARVALIRQSARPMARR